MVRLFLVGNDIYKTDEMLSVQALDTPRMAGSTSSTSGDLVTSRIPRWREISGMACEEQVEGLAAKLESLMQARVATPGV